jgi:hypothetical protein
MVLQEHVILCEGSGDVAFFRHLIEERQLPQFSVISPRPDDDPGGVEGYSSRLRALKLEAGFDVVKGLLIVGDKDRDAKSAFGNIRSKIEDAGDFGVPNKPFAIAKSQQGFPSVFVMLIPPDQDVGQLETLCLTSFRDKHPDIGKCADQFSSCSGTDKWKPGKLEKMMVRAMITAVCEEDPNTSLTHAWSRAIKMIPLTHPCFDGTAKVLAGFPGIVAAA